MKKVIIIGGGSSGIETALAVVKLKEKGIDAEITNSPEDIVNFTNDDVKQRLEIEKELTLIKPIFHPPPTRTERRKKQRKSKKRKR